MLNINELANALKPVVLPGEMMKVFILKEGKEYNQGVAYLDDGTMVVVDNARRMIGKTIDIVVTSVLQTTAGKMIFGRFIEAGGDRRSRRSSETRPRRRSRARGPAGRRPPRPGPTARDAFRRIHWWRTVFLPDSRRSPSTRSSLGTVSLAVEPGRPPRAVRTSVRKVRGRG